MKKTLYSLVALLAGSWAWAQVGDLDDLNYWGSGANRVGLAIFWNDSQSPAGLAWGYRWDGSESVTDALLYVAANDPRLFLRVDTQTGFGLGLFGVGYQTGENPFGVSGAEDPVGDPVTPVFTGGVNDLNTDASSLQAPASSLAAGPAQAGDRYKEGWNDNGYWELFHSGTSNSALEASYALPADWTSSWVGSSVALVDGAWIAFSIAKPDFSSNSPTSTIFAAAPEPGGAALVMGIAAGLFLFSRRGRVG